MKPALADLSATEISLGRSCLRKWAAQYNTDEDWGKELKYGTITGQQLHTLAEEYYRFGRKPDRLTPVGELFIEGLPHLPAPSPDLRIEQSLRVEIGGLPFGIKPDIFRGAEVWDFKTSVDPKRYGIFEKADKLNDVQTILYAYVLNASSFNHIYFRKTGQVLAIELAEAIRLGAPADLVERLRLKVQKQTTTPKAYNSPCTFTGPELQGAMSAVVLPVADRLFNIRSRRRVHPLSLPPNPAACDDFGGCPHRTKCNLTAAEKLRGYSEPVRLDVSETPKAQGVTNMAIDLFAAAAQVPAHMQPNGPAMPQQNTQPQQYAQNPNGTFSPVNAPAVALPPGGVGTGPAVLSFPAAPSTPVFPAATVPASAPANFPQPAQPPAGQTHAVQAFGSPVFQAPNTPAQHQGSVTLPAASAPESTNADAELGSAVRVLIGAIVRALKS